MAVREPLFIDQVHRTINKVYERHLTDLNGKPFSPEEEVHNVLYGHSNALKEGPNVSYLKSDAGYIASLVIGFVLGFICAWLIWGGK